MTIRALALLALLLPGAAYAVEANGPWGTFPNCTAPAVPIESETWWIQPGDDVPWHLHQGSCVPNARTVDCSDPANPVVTRDVPFDSVVTVFRYPHVDWVRYQWESSVIEKRTVDWNCGADPHHPECIFTQQLTLQPSKGNGGLDELRMSPNIDPNPFGKRHFTTLNFEVCTGTGSNHYRSRPDPIGRGWYEGTDYTNVSVNYMSFFQRGAAGLGESIPTVSGVVPLVVDHEKGIGTNESLLWEDAHTHDAPTTYLSAVPGVALPPPHGGKLLYKKDGLWKGTYSWDTRGLADGVHVLLWQTYSHTDTGTVVGGLRLRFLVKNGGASSATGGGATGGSGTGGGAGSCTACAADCDGDGSVGSSDLALLSSEFGKRCGTSCQCDPTGDGQVGAPDWNLLGKEFGRTGCCTQ
jgi:hypothetical protein